MTANSPPELIRAWLDAAGWREADLAKRTGLNKSTFTKIRTGERRMGRRAARKVSQVTAEAYARGEVSLLPLREADLAADSRERPGRTGTDS